GIVSGGGTVMAKRILVPLGTREADQAVLPLVATVARASGGTVRLLRVYPIPDHRPEPAPPRAHRERCRRRHPQGPSAHARPEGLRGTMAGPASAGILGRARLDTRPTSSAGSCSTM